ASGICFRMRLTEALLHRRHDHADSPGNYVPSSCIWLCPVLYFFPAASSISTNVPTKIVEEPVFRPFLGVFWPFLTIFGRFLAVFGHFGPFFEVFQALKTKSRAQAAGITGRAFFILQAQFPGHLQQRRRL
ncbi:MAG TPA: hypothetical protein PK722_09385, partial [Kiritimatiellia bacterium]|nr:hypothetical protein [Kiritimatiellia bacterium]